MVQVLHHFRHYMFKVYGIIQVLEDCISYDEHLNMIHYNWIVTFKLDNPIYIIGSVNTSIMYII